MTEQMLARIASLDAALGAGRLSKMGYVLRRMSLAEEDAEAIIKATPNAQAARLELQAGDQRAYSPKPARPYRS